MAGMALWGQDKPDQKRHSGRGTGWLKSPRGYKVIRISSADATAHAQWVEITDADVTDGGRMQIRHNRRMLRYNAEQLWRNLIKQGWQRVPPQW